ncbi:hypothetical protein SO802_020572 [Lithocarpus litseifolius]|uniref:Uncharacterized protein n=1 Tax=Lithocarpus litseifolius TaxID=425828 RepID=A0AAW2CCH6_9ROSI
MNEKKQKVFTGHSTGGSIAILATIWFLEKYLRPESRYLKSLNSLSDFWMSSNRREKWAPYFIHFVMRYDIVPQILLAPLSSIKQELQLVLQFLNAKASAKTPWEASNFYSNVMRNASSMASHAACNLMGNTKLLLETVTNFIALSPYKPFGTYVFCIGNGKLAILRNPDAILQLLFYSSQLCSQRERIDVAQRSLQQHFSYEKELKESFNMLDVVLLEPFGTTSIIYGLHKWELENRKDGNQKCIDTKMTVIEKAMNYLQEDYRLHCGHSISSLGCYDAFKLQENSRDFDAHVKGLELADAFEDEKKWVELGTRYRRVTEPLSIANYYRHLKNKDTGAYMDRGRPKRYRFTQRWLEHAQRMPTGSCGESCFWANVEELRIKSSGQGGFASVKEKVLQLKEQVKKWINGNELGKDVLFKKSTFMKWWETFPDEHKSNSCIKDIEGFMSV